MANDDRDRALWSAVVVQACTDVETLPIGSVEYREAEAFLVGTSAYWRRAREQVADHLGISGFDLHKAGLAWVAARRRKEGLADLPDAPRPKSLPSARASHPAMATLAAASAPLVVPPDLERVLRVGRRPARIPSANPFHPAYHRAA